MPGEHQESERDQQGSAASRRAPGPLRRVVRRTVTGAWDDDLFSESASAAFWQTLSLPPLLLGLFGILGYVGGWFGPNTVDAVQMWIVEITGNVFSHNAVEEIIAPTVRDVLTAARGEVVSVGFLLSLWSGSSAMAAFVDAITRAYGQYQMRNLVWQRTLAVLLYLVALVFVIVGLPLVAVGPDRLLALLPEAFEPGVEAMVSVLTTPVVALVLVLALAALYWIALPYKPPWWRGLPGAVLAGAVVLVGATGLRSYLDWITSTGYTYGALAAPIAFLLGTFFIALAIILGAHLNAALQAEWPAPMRRRGRLVARQLPEASVGLTEAVRLASAVRREPEATAAVLEELGYQVVRPVPAVPAQSARPDAQDHAPPDMAADRAR